MVTAVMPTYGRADVAFERGEGAYMYDTAGRRYLDFATGIATVSLGHCHPHLVEAIQRQAGQLMHCSNLFNIPGQERLADRLVANSFADTVFFGNSGAEANECAIKMVRKYHHTEGAPERYRIITFENAFHGRTLATIAATGGEKVLEGFGPKVDGFDHVAYGDVAAAAAAIGEQTGAIMIEPVQGEGGINLLAEGVLEDLRQLCDRHGLLLVLDEVQSGMLCLGHEANRHVLRGRLERVHPAHPAGSEAPTVRVRTPRLCAGPVDSGDRGADSQPRTAVERDQRGVAREVHP